MLLSYFSWFLFALDVSPYRKPISLKTGLLRAFVNTTLTMVTITIAYFIALGYSLLVTGTDGWVFLPIF